MNDVMLKPIDLDSDHELDFHVEGRNQTQVMMWCRQLKPITLREHRAHLEECAKGNKRMFFNVMENIDFPEPVGMTGLTDIDYIHRRAEFSLWIHPKYHRFGYGKKALRLLLMFGFMDLNLNRIWGETFEGNPAAGMFESLGFQKEGTRKEFYYKNGVYLDAHLYSISRHDRIL